MTKWTWLFPKKFSKKSVIEQKKTVQESKSDADNSGRDFALGLAGIPMPSAAGLAGFVIHESSTSSAKADDYCSSSSDSSSSSSYDSGSSSSSDSGSSGGSCGGE